PWGATAAGAAYCWGDNGFGQLGDGTTTSQSSPVLVQAPAGVSFAAVTGGVAHTCGVTAAGIAYCWGRNLEGQLGDGTTTNRLTPVRVVQPAGASRAAARAGRVLRSRGSGWGAGCCSGADGGGGARFGKRRLDVAGDAEAPKTPSGCEERGVRDCLAPQNLVSTTASRRLSVYLSVLSLLPYGKVDSLQHRPRRVAHLHVPGAGPVRG